MLIQRHTLCIVIVERIVAVAYGSRRRRPVDNAIGRSKHGMKPRSRSGGTKQHTVYGRTTTVYGDGDSCGFGSHGVCSRTTKFTCFARLTMLTEYASWRSLVERLVGLAFRAASRLGNYHVSWMITRSGCVRKRILHRSRVDSARTAIPEGAIGFLAFRKSDKVAHHAAPVGREKGVASVSGGSRPRANDRSVIRGEPQVGQRHDDSQPIASQYACQLSGALVFGGGSCPSAIWASARWLC